MAFSDTWVPGRATWKFYMEHPERGDGWHHFDLYSPESEIVVLALDRDSLQIQLDDLERKINESAIRGYNAELLLTTLRDFKTSFGALTPPEQSEALQCVLKGVTVHPQKLALEIFELEEFHPSSQNRKEWLALADDFRTLEWRQIPVEYAKFSEFFAPHG